MSRRRNPITVVLSGCLLAYLIALTMLLFLGMDAPAEASRAIFRMAFIYGAAIVPLAFVVMVRQSENFRRVLIFTIPVLLAMATLTEFMGNELSDGVSRLTLAVLIVYSCVACFRALSSMNILKTQSRSAVNANHS